MIQSKVNIYILQSALSKNMIISILTLLLVGNSVYGIYNGRDIPDPGDSPTKFPWVIRIAIVNQLKQNHIQEYFGGTLITSRYILTVAHPFQEYLENEPKVFKAGYYGMAYAGVYSKSEMPEIPPARRVTLNLSMPCINFPCISAEQKIYTVYSLKKFKVTLT